MRDAENAAPAARNGARIDTQRPIPTRYSFIPRILSIVIESPCRGTRLAFSEKTEIDSLPLSGDRIYLIALTVITYIAVRSTRYVRYRF